MTDLEIPLTGCSSTRHCSVGVDVRDDRAPLPLSVDLRSLHMSMSRLRSHRHVEAVSVGGRDVQTIVTDTDRVKTCSHHVLRVPRLPGEDKVLPIVGSDAVLSKRLMTLEIDLPGEAMRCHCCMSNNIMGGGGVSDNVVKCLVHDSEFSESARCFQILFTPPGSF